MSRLRVHSLLSSRRPVHAVRAVSEASDPDVDVTVPSRWRLVGIVSAGVLGAAVAVEFVVGLGVLS